MRQAEAKYRSIFENSIEGIFQTTPDGHYLSANPALAMMLGYDSAEQLISSVADIGEQVCVRAKSRDEFRKLLEHQKPASRWKNLSFGSATKWVLACALIVIAVFVR